MRNHYSILGVPFKASQNEVVAAYKMLAKKYHPDKNPSPAAHERFIEIHEAYSVLKDPGKRYRYDKSFLVKRTPVNANGPDRQFTYDPADDRPLNTKSIFSTPLVIIVSFLGIVFTALFGAVIIAAPAVLYVVFDFIPGVPARMFLLLVVAIPYWVWLYKRFEKHQ